MKIFSALLIGFTLSTSSFALDINEIAGRYKGTCTDTYKKYQYSTVTTRTGTHEAALYVGKYTNLSGNVVDLAFSTDLTYGEKIPESLAFLLNADEAAEKFVEYIIRAGLTGTDNNIGSLYSSNNKYNYVSKNEGDTLTVTADQYTCAPGVFCNPPEVNVCRYDDSHYRGCLAEKDVTVVRKLADNKLVSERFVSQYGTPMNNYSFYIPEVTSVCVWEKQ